MENPLVDWSNCIIAIPNNDAALVKDAKGNMVSSGGTTSECKLYLKEAEDWSKRQHYYKETGDGQSLFLEGYVVEPMALPAHIKLPQRFPARYETTPGNYQDCEFECRARQVPVPMIQTCMGQAIEGFIRWTR